MLDAIGALGLVSTVFIGLTGLAIAGAAIGVFVVVRRRRSRACTIEAEPVDVELMHPTS